jgi:hypothetical protein
MDDNSDSPIDDSIEVAQRKVPVQMTVIEAVEVLDAFKQKLVDESYDVMLEEGESEVKVPVEVVDALEVMIHYVNTSFELEEDL